ncbi:hypothetical protein [Devosia sp. A16]|uniref:hypothetical protein n=1 Tax=Devosia sp. A16 TaxID=1736675 RepID=UPI0006D7C0C0|nr:hypothetical protein [Devosia sp. A16]
MKKLLTAAAALVLSLPVAVPLPAFAQNTVDGVMTTCTDVINLQYEDDHSRDTQCITAVADFLTAIGAASNEADPQIADLVLKLLELYRDDQQCKIAETELPQAIETAAGKVLDGTVKVEYVQIVQQIQSCDFSTTAAITPEPVVASSN